MSAGLLALGLHGGTAAQPLSEGEGELLARQYLGAVKSRLLAVDSRTPLEPELRTHGAALAAEAEQVLGRLLRTWVLTPETAQSIEELNRRFTLGMLQAWARWHLARADDALAPAWLSALRSPVLCDRGKHEPAWLTTHLRQVQAIDPAARAAAMAADHAALKAMADDAWQAPARPSPSLSESVLSWLIAQREGLGERDGPGMPPHLAVRLFRADADPERWSWTDRCAMAQWWVRDAVQRRGIPPAVAMPHFHFATMVHPQDLLGAAPKVSPGYPPLAMIWDVEASIEVQWQRDAQGGVAEPRVVARRVRVPNAPGASALPWDDQFDLAALAAARSQPPRSAEAGRAFESAVFEFKLQ